MRTSFISGWRFLLARWMNSNWRHAQRLLAMAVLRPDWLRFFGLYCPPLRSSCSPWERRYWEEVLRARSWQVQKDGTPLRPCSWIILII